jgi:hypothetical protein
VISVTHFCETAIEEQMLASRYASAIRILPAQTGHLMIYLAIPTILFAQDAHDFDQDEKSP